MRNRRLTEEDRIKLEQLRAMMLREDPGSAEYMEIFFAALVILVRGKVADRHRPAWVNEEAERWGLEKPRNQEEALAALRAWIYSDEPAKLH